MTTRLHSIIVLGAAALLLSITSARGEEKKISMDQAPPAVQEAAKKIAAGAEITDFSKEVEDGKTTFEAEYKVDGVEHSAAFAEDGKLVQEEVDVKISELPEAVSSAIAKAMPDGKIKEAAKGQAEGKTFYELDVLVGQESHEVKIAVDGTVISNKVDKEDKENAQDEKDEKQEKEQGH